MRVLTVDEVLLFLETLRSDPTREHLLRTGGDLLREAQREGLLQWGDFAGFTERMLELQKDGLVEWRPGAVDHSGRDLLNASEFRVTAAGRREVREIASRPRPALDSGCEQALEQRGWLSALEELHEGDAQLAETHWIDAIADYYRAVESGLKLSLEEAGVQPGAGAALKALAAQAAQHGVIPSNYQALFGYVDSVRSPHEHGRGAEVKRREPGPEEALLMANHTRSLLLYLAQRAPTRSPVP